MRLRSLATVCLLIPLLVGCQADAREEPARSQPAAQEAAVRIVVLGSSTAEGAGPADVNDAWVNRFRTYCRATVERCEVINLARGGYTTYHILPTGTETPENRPAPDAGRNITEALWLQPMTLIINLPSNDAATGYSVTEQLHNYRLVLEAAEQEGVPVWMATTQPRNLSDEQRQNLMAVRDSTYALVGKRAIDFWTGLAREDGTINAEYDSGDGIHLNGAAHRVLYERVRKAGVIEQVVRKTAFR